MLNRSIVLNIFECVFPVFVSTYMTSQIVVTFGKSLLDCFLTKRTRVGDGDLPLLCTDVSNAGEESVSNRLG